jgi:excisionase family DNA binding protein
MNENDARGLYNDRINRMVDSLLPNGAGPMTEHRLRHALDQVAQVAFSAGRSYALTNILTVEQAAEEIGVSRRRMAEIIRTRHDRFGTGMRVGRSWLIHRDEIESLRPGPEGWPRGRSRK